MSMMNVVSVSKTSHDDFEAVFQEVIASGSMPTALHQPAYDTETPWSSIIHTFSQPHKAHKTFTVTVQIAGYLKERDIAQNSLVARNEIIEFLEHFAAATKAHTGKKVMLSNIIHQLFTLRTKCTARKN